MSSTEAVANVLNQITDISSTNGTADVNNQLTDAELDSLSTSLVTVADALTTSENVDVGQVADVRYIILSILTYAW